MDTSLKTLKRKQLVAKLISAVAAAAIGLGASTFNPKHSGGQIPLLDDPNFVSTMLWIAIPILVLTLIINLRLSRAIRKLDRVAQSPKTPAIPGISRE
ncbi:hypothetical protein ADIMK_1248 [Marinobacterium lacunae]|uniref:Uncharacterized protein n=1 Tax=Marinobacterium lacunae TaxID=1232683 RepID=A0A081G1Z0_9GAMM|nr:hypothetical protein [Marinobacterium lacunae]KEA64795.1 hypothetical protein ADIMK_1248 [Marinobacterium lacunae]MBR9885629.1 hypothetical protein [Oceanospirillales bacterium]